jgi:hypothetical protein
MPAQPFGNVVTAWSVESVCAIRLVALPMGFLAIYTAIYSRSASRAFEQFDTGRPLFTALGAALVFIHDPH